MEKVHRIQSFNVTEMSCTVALVTLNEDSRIENYTFDFQKHKQMSLVTERSDKYLA